MTGRYALFGSPIAHSPSPAMHNAGFAALGLDSNYALRPAGPEDVAELMAFAMGEMGMRDLDFWELTPYELHRRLIGWRRKQDGRRLNSLYQAWHSAAFARAKRLPTLTRILKPLKTRKLEGNELEVRKREFEQGTKRAGVKIFDGSNLENVLRGNARHR